MKKSSRFWFLTAILFSIFFSFSTLFYRVQVPSITLIRVVMLGWPFQWLKETVLLVPPSSAAYSVQWAELFSDVVLLFAASAIISYLATWRDREGKDAAGLSPGIKITILVVVAYFTRILSCAVHEVLGHGLWALAMGAQSISVNVTFLGFGWCSWEPPLAGIQGLLATSGGIISTFAAGAVILAFLYYMPATGKFYSRLILFWIAYWTTITQASYLIVGGITGFGDIGYVSRSLGIDYLYFAVIGVPLFILVYSIVSVLFFGETGVMFESVDQRKLLSAFWLTVPVLVVTFSVSQEFLLPVLEFALMLAISFIPSIMAFPMYVFFRRISRQLRKKAASAKGNTSP